MMLVGPDGEVVEAMPAGEATETGLLKVLKKHLSRAMRGTSDEGLLSAHSASAFCSQQRLVYHGIQPTAALGLPVARGERPGICFKTCARYRVSCTEQKEILVDSVPT